MRTRRGCRISVIDHRPVIGDPEPGTVVLNMRMGDGRWNEVLLTNEERIDLAILLLRTVQR